METTKGLEALREQLLAFEQDITESITTELKRIGRAVTVNELAFVPFDTSVAEYMAAIRIDENGDIVLDTTFSDVELKYLSDCISDNEIIQWDLISLLGMLKDIEI